MKNKWTRTYIHTSVRTQLHSTSATWVNLITIINLSLLYGLHSSEGTGDKWKRTSDRAWTWDLRSIAEFDPHEPLIPVTFLHPPVPYTVQLLSNYNMSLIRMHLRTCHYCAVWIVLYALIALGWCRNGTKQQYAGWRWRTRNRYTE